MSDGESPDTTAGEADGPGLDLGDAAAAGSGASGAAEPYRVLARKYRPTSFDELIGQEAMVRTLRNAFASGRIAQAYMLTGVRGVGKTTTARILARALNYETDEVKRPSIDFEDGEGVHDRAILEGRHPDVIEMDAASHTGVDNMRDILASLQYAPTSARQKVYIIDEVHMLSSGAFNAMLKTLEEPPPHVRFVFATTEIRKVPITVLSRCQRFDLRRVDAAMMMEHLRGIAEKEGVGVEDDALAAIARASEGSVRDALSLLDQAIALSVDAEGRGTVEAGTVRDMLGLADRARVVDLFEALMAGDMKGALDEFAAQYDAGAQPHAVLTDLAAHTHLVSRLKFVPGAADDPSLSEAERTRGTEAAGRLSTGTLSRAWQLLLRGLDEVDRSPDARRAVDMVLIRLAHASTLPGPGEALRALENGGVDAPTGAPAAPPARPGGARAALAPARGNTALRAASDAALDLDARFEGARAALPRETAPDALRAGGRGHLALVHDADALPAPTPEATPSPGAAEAIGGDPLLDPARVLGALAELASERRDIAMRTLLRRQLRLVSLDAADPARPVLTVTSDDALDRGFAPNAARRLSEWTGLGWAVRHEPYGEGGPTLVEIERREHQARIDHAADDPDVAAVLAAFPGARVIDVRALGAEATADEEDDATAPEGVPLDPDAEGIDEIDEDGGFTADPDADEDD